MPLWETWIKRKADPLADDPSEREDKYDFRGISRRARRAMARARATREWQERTT